MLVDDSGGAAVLRLGNVVKTVGVQLGPYHAIVDGQREIGVVPSIKGRRRVRGGKDDTIRVSHELESGVRRAARLREKQRRVTDVKRILEVQEVRRVRDGAKIVVHQQGKPVTGRGSAEEDFRTYVGLGEDGAVQRKAGRLDGLFCLIKRHTRTEGSSCHFLWIDRFCE
ncbi:hypothetical protein EBZ38_12570 [bacterium]|nr:hypothetical protein [bacterium]NDC95267.1 hypothetical protein [bacterium]NDD85090.1 hypothetical protein [bacterium]